MAVKLGDNELRPPVRPKLKDPDAERVAKEFEDKIRELQGVVRRIAGA